MKGVFLFAVVCLWGCFHLYHGLRHGRLSIGCLRVYDRAKVPFQYGLLFALYTVCALGGLYGLVTGLLGLMQTK